MLGRVRKCSTPTYGLDSYTLSRECPKQIKDFPYFKSYIWPFETELYGCLFWFDYIIVCWWYYNCCRVKEDMRNIIKPCYSYYYKINLNIPILFSQDASKQNPLFYFGYTHVDVLDDHVYVGITFNFNGKCSI